MAAGRVDIVEKVNLESPKLLMGFSGWMDGGDVSTGTIECFIDKLGATKFAKIDPSGYYIYNFPGTMEISSIFRPYCRIEDGIVKEFDEPEGVFYVSPKDELILFAGKEPNMNWKEFTSNIFDFCEQQNVREIFFIGSVAGLVPHTREPRISSSVSDQKMRDKMQKYAMRFSNYSGPSNIVTYMLKHAPERDISMATLVSEVPAYVHGKNPRCIEAVSKRIAAMLGIRLSLDDLRLVGDEIEKKINEVVAGKDELANHIKKLEADYDNEIFDVEMDDLKQWLVQQGIRLD